MAASSTKAELDALEQARSRLEMALDADENWRALRQPRADSPGVGAEDAARTLRDMRLEMALATNAHYLAWKRITDAIAGGDHPRGALLEEVESLLRGGLQARIAGQAATPPAGESPSPRAADRLADRLDRLDEDDGPPMAPRRPAKRAEAPAPPVSTDPPEATVTFVVRESSAPILPSADLPPDLGTQRNSDLFERLRNLRASPPQPTGGQVDAPAAPVEEAEVTIISAEGLRLRREAEERADFVQRFRKALSGD